MMEFLTTCEIAKHSYIKHCFSHYQSISCSRKNITNSTRKSTILPGWLSILWLCFNCSSNFMQRSEDKRTCIIINVIIICTEMRFWVIKVLITHIYLYFTFNVLKREIWVVSLFQLISFYIEMHVCIYKICMCIHDILETRLHFMQYLFFSENAYMRILASCFQFCENMQKI